MAIAYDQPTPAPTPKMTAVGIAGSLTVIVLYVIKATFGIDVPGEVASALTIVISFLAGYFKHDEH